MTSKLQKYFTSLHWHVHTGPIDYFYLEKANGYHFYYSSVKILALAF